MTETDEIEELEEEIEEVEEEPRQLGSFTIKHDNPKILKGIVETLATIIDETEFLVTPDEFTITAMDQSRICLLKLSIKKEHFDEYECETRCKIGLNLDDFEKILKRCTNNERIELHFTEDDQKIKIKMKKEGSSRVRTFSLSLLDIDIEEVPMDTLFKIDYTSTWGIDPDILIEAIKDAEIYAEILNIKAEEGKGLAISSSGQIGEMLYELDQEDLLEPDLNGLNTGSYSLTFLKAILKIASITEKLEISLKSDHPLKMNFELLEGGELNYFLAPRVDSEEPDEDDMDDF